MLIALKKYTVKRYVCVNSQTKHSMYVTYKSFDEKQDAINAVKSRWWENHTKYQKMLASLNNNNAHVAKKSLLMFMFIIA